MLLIAIALAFVEHIVTTEKCSVLDMIDNHVTRGHKLTKHVVWSSKTKDIMECVQNCVRRRECQSINYDTVINLCEINRNTRKYGSLEKASDFVYSEFSTWPSQIDPDCYARPCPGNQVCIPGRIQKKEPGPNCSYTCLDLGGLGTIFTTPSAESQTSTMVTDSSLQSTTSESVSSTVSMSGTDTSSTSGSGVQTSTLTGGTETSVTSSSGSVTLTSRETNEPETSSTSSGSGSTATNSATNRPDTSFTSSSSEPVTSTSAISGPAMTTSSSNTGSATPPYSGRATGTASTSSSTESLPQSSLTSGIDDTLTTLGTGFVTQKSPTSGSVTSSSAIHGQNTNPATANIGSGTGGSPDSDNGIVTTSTSSTTTGTSSRTTSSTTTTIDPAILRGVRFVGGLSSYAGRFELYDKQNTVWRSVQLDTDVWSWKTTEVVCRQLGYFFGGSYHLPGKPFPAGNTGSLVFEGLSCNGNENSIFDCQSDNYTTSPDNSNDIGITCFLENVDWGDNIHELNLQLVTSEGKLNPLPSEPSIAKIEYRGTWTRVCGELLAKAADVFCRTMYGTEWNGSSSSNKTSPMQMWTKNIACYQDDTPHPFYCMNEGWTYENCEEYVLLSCDRNP